jgi:hypothetical protein
VLVERAPAELAVDPVYALRHLARCVIDGGHGQ